MGLKILLSLPAALYGAVQRIWATSFAYGFLRAENAPIPVISVGNILMGGAGKTPFVIYLAKLLVREGMRPAVISRGYKGSNRAPWLIVSDGRSGHTVVDANCAGDEPVLIANSLPQVPVIVARRRIHGVEAASRELGCNCALLDDGFQHLRLRRNLDIVLLSGREDYLFPLGWLREPVSALKRGHIFVLTGNIGTLPPEVHSYLARVPLFHCRTVPLAVGTEEYEFAPPWIYRHKPVILVSAIAHPDRFFQTAVTLGWDVQAHHVFPDHYRFSPLELEKLWAVSSGIPLVFTEKDWVRLPPWFRKKSERIRFLRVGVELDDEVGLLAAVREHLGIGHA